MKTSRMNRMLSASALALALALAGCGGGGSSGSVNAPGGGGGGGANPPTDTGGDTPMTQQAVVDAKAVVDGLDADAKREVVQMAHRNYLMAAYDEMMAGKEGC